MRFIDAMAMENDNKPLTNTMHCLWTVWDLIYGVLCTYTIKSWPTRRSSDLVLSHVSRAAVVSADCLFCVYFGRKEKVGAKQGCTIHTNYFKSSFFTDCYTQHHHKQNPELWEEYQATNDAGKKAFFEEQLPLKEKLHSFFSKKMIERY